MTISNPHNIVRFEEREGVVGIGLVYPGGALKHSVIPFSLKVERLPKHGSVWVCEVLRHEPNPTHIGRGCYHVKPVEELTPETGRLFELLRERHGLIDARGLGVTLTPNAKRQLVCCPDMIKELAHAVSRKNLSLLTGGERLNVEVELEDEIEQDVIGAPTIRENQPTTFAYRRGYKYPVRVITYHKAVYTPALSLQFVSRRLAAPFLPRITTENSERIWVLHAFRAGRLGWHEPTVLREPLARESSLEFWLSHAHTHFDGSFGEPFVSSWNSIIKNAMISEFKQAG